MENFRCVTDDLLPIIDCLREIQRELEQNWIKASNVLEQIGNEDVWKGEAALVGAAFLDLVVKYHSLLVSGENGGPIIQAYTGLEEYLCNDNSFYSEWKQFQVIKEM